MSNKVFFVHEVEEYEGLYIGAPNRDKAKTIGYNEIGCDFVDVRVQTIKGETTEYSGILPKEEIRRVAGDEVADYEW